MHLQLFERRLREGCDRFTMVDKLLRVSEESADFTLDDVKSECNTIMMAVSIRT